MLIDRPQVTETSQVINLTVPRGTAEPADPDTGELFYRTDLNELRVYTGTGWAEVGSTGLTTHENRTDLHLTSEQNTLLDGINSTVSSTEINYLDGVTAPIQGQLDTLGASASTHAADDARHLTPEQNTLLDGLASTLTAAELNYVDGVTGPVQSQLDAIVAVNNTQNTALSSLQTQINNNASSGSTALSTHATDDGLHLTAVQNTFLDGLSLPTLTSSEANYLIGVTSSIQTQLNTLTSTKLARNGSQAMQGSLAMGGFGITGLATPSAGTDAANRDYVDNLVQGIFWKPAVRVATTANITLNGLQTIDGVALVANDRVLVKDQTTTSQNGIWLVSSTAWSRAPDADNSPQNELDAAAVFVREGALWAATAWVQTLPVTTINVSPISWAQFSAAGGAVAGNGIVTAGAVISVKNGNGLTFSGTSLTLNINTDFNLAGPALSLATVPTLTAGTYGNSTTVPVLTLDAKGRVTAATNTAITGFQPADSLLTSIAGLGGTGIIVQTAAGAAANRSIAVAGNGLSIVNGTGVSGNPTVTSDATSANTADSIVYRDGSGNFSAGTITATLNGTASNANLLNGIDTSQMMVSRGTVALASINTATSHGFYNEDNSGFSKAVLVFNPGGSAGTVQYRHTYNTGPGELFEFRNRTDNLTWQPWRTVLHEANYSNFSPTLTGGGASGTWAINITGNAGTVDGLSVSTGVNNVANQIVRTNGSGYTDFGWINTISGNNGTTPITRVYASDDAYIRYYTLTNFCDQITRFDNIATINGFSPPNGAIRLTPNLHLNAAAGNAVIINWDNGGSGSQLALRVGNGASSDVFTVTHAGTVVADGDITAFSDRRLKVNIQSICGALETVGRLQGVTFQRADTSKHGMGLIAQDVQAVVPEVVHESTTGMLSVAYGNLVGLLIEAIKELKAEVDELKKDRS